MSAKRSRAMLLLFMASLITVYFFVNFQKAVLIPVFNELQTDFGVGAGAVTGVVTAFMLVYSAMQLVTGLLVDRYGGARVLVAGTLFLAVGAALFPLSTRLWMLYFSRILTGIGAGTIYLSAVKEIDRLFPGSFTKVLGITMLVGYIGTGFAGPPVIWAVGRFGSWRLALGAFDALLAAAATLLIVFAAKMPKPPVNREVKLFSAGPYLAAFRNRDLRHMLGASPFMYAAFIMLLNTIVKKMLEDVGHFSAQSAGVVFSGMVALSAGFQLVPGALENLLHRRRKKLFLFQMSLAWFGVALAAAGILAAKGGALTAAGAMMVAGVWMLAAAGGSTPLTTSIFREVSDPKMIGVALSLSNCLVYLLTSALGQASGFLLEYFGRGAVVRTENAVIYPPGSYLAVMVMLLAMVTFAIWNGSRVPETNGRNIYRS